MPTLHTSQSEAAHAAALQAEFNEKRWVWVPDEKEGYLAGWVNSEREDEAEIVMAAGGDVCSSCSCRHPCRHTITDTESPRVCFVQDESSQI
jgi:hypothetical protein